MWITLTTGNTARPLLVSLMLAGLLAMEARTLAEEVQPQAQPEAPVSQPASGAEQASPLPQTVPPPLMPEQVDADKLKIPDKGVIVPSNTVVTVALDKTLSTSRSQPGQEVTGTVVEDVYVGPYKVIPKGTLVHGVVQEVNRKRDKDGRNPFLMIRFDTLKRPDDLYSLAFQGTLITYKSGLTRQEYAWRLPSPREKSLVNLKTALAGAVSGAFINPIFGPLVGAGASLLRSAVVDRVARGSGSVEVKAKAPVPIAVDESFTVPVAEYSPERDPSGRQGEDSGSGNPASATPSAGGEAGTESVLSQPEGESQVPTPIPADHPVSLPRTGQGVQPLPDGIDGEGGSGNGGGDLGPLEDRPTRNQGRFHMEDLQPDMDEDDVTLQDRLKN